MRWLTRFNSGLLTMPLLESPHVPPRYGSASPTNAIASTNAIAPTNIIALGGGGARGLAHLGVLAALEDTGVEVHRLVGVSIGSLVAACYAVEGNAKSTTARAMKLLGSPRFRDTQRRLLAAGRPHRDVVDNYLTLYQRFRRLVTNHRRLTRAVTTPALLDSTQLVEVIDQLLPDIDVSETRLPVSIVAADLRSGHQVVIESGSLRRAVLGSMSIPGIFPPIEFGKALLSDIGVLHSLPVQVARSYEHDKVIAVDVGVSHAPTASCETALDVMMRMEEVGEKLLRRHSLDAADVVIRPDVGWCTWFDFGEPDRLFRAGYRAVRHTVGQFPAMRSDRRCLRVTG